MTFVDRYLVNFDINDIPKEQYDVVIIGSGIAGVYTALQMDSSIKVAVVTKETVEISNSVLAQGGIAVPLGRDDSPECHFRDTVYAGAGLCDEETVRILVNEAAENIEILCRYGVNFDRGEDQQLLLSREGAHSKNRIVHTGDSTGKEVCDTLIKILLKHDNVRIFERTFAIDIVTEARKCIGLIAYEEDSKSFKLFLAGAVVCAAGGYGQLYNYTTNPQVTTGDGVALAYRAGCRVMNPEFVQFHPTVLYHPEDRSFLITEAVRGEGAILLNIRGERFMPAYHPMAELAPRDVVSRAIFQELQKTGSTHVYLDISHKDPEYVKNRFPTIYKTCLRYGIDITKDRIPVAPAAHYSMGGIKTDEWGRTGIEGFYACGEAACNGIHGANRLASNSLLEGLVFGRRIATELTGQILNRTLKEARIPDNLCHIRKSNEPVKNAGALKSRLRTLMTEKVGIIRNGENLQEALNQVLEMKAEIEGKAYTTVEHWELVNMLTLSELVIRAALMRRESRGAHYRSDYPQTDDVNFRKNTVL
ncbi:L-aspartate oxidase [Thermoclostridium stercorarium]|uniref:L-aspartate oxidase n=1 Tax=Thermoclostridium stercorarium TaxID=1510 RepID=UPI0022489D31|nr:L-aspartate oxidase [Thermoclostridium stercorarium]UZQ85600.1 L-aspartate oxidase [Thermoclostridium stercorarium]